MEDNNYFKTPTEIEEETGRSFKSICEELLNEGLSPTEVARQLKVRNSSYITRVVRVQKNTIKEGDYDEYTEVLKKHNVASRFPELEKAFIKYFDITYEDYLRNKYIEEKLSHFEIATLLGCSQKSIERHLKHYNIRKTKSQARRDAIDKGLINYEKIHQKSRITRRKSNSQSHGQDHYTDMFKSFIEARLTSNDDVEVVVGSNEWSILKKYEVDIPIVFILDNHCIKFAIEVNGAFWHVDRTKSDKEKEDTLSENNWHLFVIDYSDHVGPVYEEMEIIVELMFDEVNRVWELSNKQIKY
ncbi:hypothetical protein ACTWQB_08795 [Piscibacillus sp. B03]|uniref:hypothetical protein n=1 Tax=Piscibacillus sp. B03 TaxID=3457430 RepID=UPI003FCD44CF